MAIHHYYQVSERLSCSGQPTEAQLIDLANEGCQVIINLGLLGQSYSLPDEAATVSQLGIDYWHIPVIWEAPQPEDLKRFFEVMQQCKGKKVHVHCAANYRASTFVGLYLVAHEQLREEKLAPFLQEIWQPNAIWESFIEEALETNKEGF